MATKSDPSNEQELEGTRALMGALIRQPPKPHDAMKIGKKKKSKKKAKKKD
jgi:hypothetical protein